MKNDSTAKVGGTISGDYPFDIGNAMCCTLRASTDSTVEAGAPGNKIEITPAIIEAGADII